MVWWRWRALPVAMVCRVLVTVMLAVVFSLVPPVVLAEERGFRGWPSASAGPTVMSGASGDGGSLLGRPPPFEPQVYGENIAVDGAGREINGVLAVATDEQDTQTVTATRKSN